MALACSGGATRTEAAAGLAPVPVQAAGAKLQLDAATFGSDPQMQHRILGVGFTELHQCLGAFVLHVHSHWSWQRGEEGVAQQDVGHLRVDADGHLALALETPASSLHLQQLGSDLYVRYDKGTLRQKTRRDMATLPLCDQVVATLPQALALLPGVDFVDPQPDRVDGRPATRYRLRLASPLGTPLPDHSPAWHFPVTPPPRWRAQLQRLQVAGFVSLDAATGLMLRGNLELSGQVADGTDLPAGLSLRLDLLLSHVGRVDPVLRPTKAVAEFRRPLRHRDPLHFFRDQLGSAATSSSPAGG